MNILRIIYDWPPPWIGLVPQPYEITRSQVKQGHKLDVFCGRWPSFGELERPSGVNVHSFWREPIKGVWGLTTSVFVFFYYLVWRMYNTPDIIHAHGHFGLWIFFYRKLLSKVAKNSRELKIPLVAHFHITAKGRWVAAEEKNATIAPISKRLSWPMEVWANKLAIYTANAYIFTSNLIKDEAIKYYGADPSKCYVLESGVNPDLFKPVNLDEKTKTRHDLGFLDNDKILLSYGYIVERKNIHVIVEALKHLPVEYKLLLLGEGDPEYLERINKVARDFHLTDRVVRVGYTPYPDIPVAIQASDILILPSSYEGLPKTVMETLACGIPALATGFKLELPLQGLHYLESITPESIASQVSQIINSKGYIDVDKVRDIHSWDKKVEQIQIIYDTIL